MSEQKMDLQKLAAMAAAMPPPPVVGTNDAMVKLQDYIEERTCTVLNADNKTSIKSILKQDGVLKSDADVDHQLLLFISFTEAVKIRGIYFTLLENKDEKESKISKKESGPKSVKVYVDNINLDFGDVSGTAIKPTQSFTFTKNDLLNSKEIQTQFVKFTNVHTLTIYVETNQADTEVTILNRIGFIGTPIAGMKVAAIKKMGEE